MVDNVSVYIPAYNVAKFLSRTIDGVLAQTYPADEILLIDDGSSDATVDIAGRYPSVTVVRHDSNRGLSAARNTAFRTARNELVASLDADCVPTTDWLARLVPHLKDHRVVGVGGRLVESVRRTVADRWRCAHLRQEQGESLLRNTDFLFGCNNLFRKSAVIEAGGYNEVMRTNGEDADLSRKLRAMGRELVYEPAACVMHLRSDTIRSILDTSWRWGQYGIPLCPRDANVCFVLARSIYVNFRYTFLNLLRRDARLGRVELLGIDFLTLAYYPYRDFRRWRAAQVSPEVQIVSSAV
ncbi:MAG TPA: glycosyltransferase family 2 protein [Candidatus Dormibacteraeota bacterium]|nr:glycosyltransferase family 2 protein [Candidatus Dormibacteraeota bacterium]